MSKWQEHVEAYLADKAELWSPATLKSERARLNSLVPFLEKHGFNGKDLYADLAKEGYGRYTLKTAFIRMTDLEAFLLDTGRRQNTPSLRPFMRRFARLFSGVYQRVAVGIELAEALNKINLLEDAKIRAHALFIVSNGLRFAESQTLDQSSGAAIITGKGKKEREILGSLENGAKYTGSYLKFYRALKGVGLKPHDLRKLAATNFLKAGIDLHDLCRVMGWSSLDTAMHYLQSSKKPELQAKIRGAIGF